MIAVVLGHNILWAYIYLETVIVTNKNCKNKESRVPK